MPGHKLHYVCHNVRLRLVPHFSSGIVERAKRERAWKSPHARKGDMRRGERKMRDYRQSPSFGTNALLSQRKTLIGSSMEICQHLSKTRQPLSALDIITICRTNNSSEQITRVALVAVTKKKANPATDEVRVENRNHGLAWSQCKVEITEQSQGCYKCKLFQKLSPREELRTPGKDSHYLQKNKR